MITKHDQLRMAIHAELAPYDAFGGVAYGKKEMPFAITAGIAAGSALAAGAVVGTAATAAAVGAVVAGTAVAAGLTMTIVGMATGDKELMKIGGYVGLAGGIAGAGLNMAGFGASAFSGMEAAASAASTTPASLTNAAAGGISSGSAMTSAITPTFGSMANPVAQTGATMGQIGSGSLQATASQALTPAFEAAKTGAMTAGQVAPNVLANAPQAITPVLSELGTTAIKAAPTAAQAIGGTAATGAAASQGAGTLFDGLSEFMKTPTGLAAVAELGKGVVGTITGSAQNDIYKNKIAFDQQQAAYQNANANAIAPYGMTTTQLTDAQRQQANIDKYNQAKKAAGILTNTQQATA